MKYKTLASKEVLKKTVKSLESHGYKVLLAKNRIEALEEIKKFIPAGSTVMNGSSVTLEQIGYQDYLTKSENKWIDYHAKVRAESDPAKRTQLRKESLLEDYYLGSVHALTENGEAIIASNTGSQLPYIAFTSPNLIFTVSTKKIVPNLAEGMKRLEEYVVPLEDKHMQELYKVGTALNKILIFKGENKMIGRKITFILIEEDLGF